MPIIEPAIRPPAEAESFLLQVTLGCSANSCTFCGAYQGKPFRVKAMTDIQADIDWGSQYLPDTRRVCLLDGDALALNNARLIPILQQLNLAFPRLNRIASYANGYNITSRSTVELEELYQHKLRLLYIGLESGSQKVLDYCQKRSRVAEMIAAVRRAEESGIKSSVIVLLGLGGRENSGIHVRDTILALNEMQPRYLSFLSLMLIPGTELYQATQRGEFMELSPGELLQEMRDIIAGLELRKTVFRSDHASNYLPLEGRLPQDKERLLQVMDEAISGKSRLRPEFLRGL